MLAIAAGLYVSVSALVREVQVARAERWVETQAHYLARNNRLSPNLRPIDLSLPPRALLQEAQSRLLQAPFTASEAEREQILSHAWLAINAALAGRPNWGEAQMALAYLHSLRGQRGALAARVALNQSYANAPYLRGAAQWRVQYAFAHWAQLPEETRARAVDEAVWYIRLRHDYREPVFEAARRSPAYVPLMLRWREVRLRDEDLMPN